MTPNVVTCDSLRALLWNDAPPVALDFVESRMIWAESVTPDGRFMYRCEKRNHKPFFHLRAVKDEWLKVDRPCVLLQRTTAKEQRRRLIAAALPARFIQKYGWVAVSGYELESLSLPDPAALDGLKTLVGRRASQETIETECKRLYGLEHE